MDTQTFIRLGFRRLLILLAVSVVIVWPVSELAYQMQKDENDRPPQVIQLVIPAGTSANIKSGQAVTAIPQEMVFVIGDTLVVKNEDSVTHQLGPLLIPAGTSASLAMSKVSNLSYACSFQPSRYLGLNVIQGTTWMTRLSALGLTAPSLGLFLFVYSLVMYPLGGKKQSAASHS